MGYVFCAEHTMIAREYALKMLAPEQLNESSRKRFEAEGRAIANLDHANIVKVYNMGLDGGEYPFYVMDLLDGVALSDCIKLSNGIDFFDCLEIFSQIAAGLGYAHGRGIIHRDVKPSNILLLTEPDGKPLVKIVDFGIAKVLTSAGMKHQSQTATGEVFGSPFYMSPEQCMGETIDARSDIYSLGCALFEALSGKPPFRGQNAMETVMMHQSQPVPSLLLLCPQKDFPTSIDFMIAKMMAKRPDWRYSSMTQLTHDFERLKAGKQIGRSAAVEIVAGEQLFDDLEEQIESTDGEEELHDFDTASSARKWSLLKSMTAIFCFLLFACLGWTFIPKALQPSVIASVTPPAVPAKSIAAANKSTPNMLADLGVDRLNGDFPNLPPLNLEESRKAFNKCKSIFSESKKIGGVLNRVYHFPSILVGVISFNGKDDRPAVNTVCKEEPVLKPTLICKVTETKAIDLPDIFKKIAPDEFVSLSLTGHGKDETGASGLRHILDTVAAWSNLTDISLASFTINEEVLDGLDKIKSLKRLDLHPCTWEVKNPGASAVWQKLTFLMLATYPDADRFIGLINGSPNLEELRLYRSPVSAQSIKALASCPNIKRIDFLDSEISDDVVTALGEIKTLITVEIGNTCLTPEQLQKLCAMPNLRHIKLIALENSDPRSLKAFACPKVKFQDK